MGFPAVGGMTQPDESARNYQQDTHLSICLLTQRGRTRQPDLGPTFYDQEPDFQAARSSGDP